MRDDKWERRFDILCNYIAVVAGLLVFGLGLVVVAVLIGYMYVLWQTPYPVLASTAGVIGAGAFVYGAMVHP